MTTIVTRAGKGSALTHNEVDSNFTNLNSAKYEAGNSAALGASTVSANTSNAAFTITQTGTGNALVVEDSASPDATPFVIDASGNVLISTNIARTDTINGLGSRLQIEGAGSAERAAAIIGRANQSRLVLGRQNGAENGNNNAVSSGNTIGQVDYMGADGTGLIPAATISSAVDGTPGTNDMPGRLVFSTTPSGSATPVERMRIGSNGNVGIGTTNPQYVLSFGNGFYGLDYTGDKLALKQVASSSNAVAVESVGRVEISADTNANGTGEVQLLTRGIERMRIANAGQVLIGGTSPVAGAANGSVDIQNTSDAQLSITRYAASTAAPNFYLNKSRGASVGTNTLVASGDTIGGLIFRGADGTNYIQAASISAAVDGTPGTNDMPGRLVFSTTADGASSPTERMRITSGGASVFSGDVRAEVLSSVTVPANSNTAATATAASLRNGIRTGTPTANINLGVPTGTNMDAAFQELQTNHAFEWSVINLAAATHVITVVANTGHTVVGNMAVAANSSGRFLSRKTATNTFITYRIG